MYGGAWLSGLPLDHGPSHDTTVAAVQATAGEVRRYADNSIALTEFALSTGGHTAPQSEGNGFPAVDDQGDDTVINTRQVWTVTINSTDIEAAYPSVGQFSSIQVIARNGLGAWGGRTRGLLVTGSAGSVTVNIANLLDDSFRQTFRLYSDWYRFPQYDNLKGDAFWLAKDNGTVLDFGSATRFGDASDLALHEPVVAMASTPSGFGYWLVAADGGVFNFGDAGFYGSASDLALHEPVVAMASTPSGFGYWLVAADGGVFNFGDAGFYGSASDLALHEPVVAMASTPSGFGYWLVAADGGVFNFGDAGFYGSASDLALHEPVVAMASTPSGFGYWLVAADGGVFNFGDAPLFGSRAVKANRGDVVAIGVTVTGNGYWLITETGTSYPFGDAPDFISSIAGPTIVAIAAPPLTRRL